MGESADTYDLLGIGFGPSNLALAAAVASEESPPAWAGKRVGFLERRGAFSWHPDMLLEGSRLQVAFIKDLVTLTNPRSPFTFVNYLHTHGRLEDFLNLRSFYPSREEYQDYFCWVARQLRHLVRYGAEVTSIRPCHAPDGSVRELEVVSRDVETGQVEVRRARNLALSLGGRPALPAGITQESLDERLFHSAHFLTRIRPFAEAGTDRPYRFLVVGGGQSAAEVFRYLSRTFPRASVSLAIRRFSLMPADSSPLSNQIFDSQMVEFFYGLPELRKHEVLENLHHTNYAAVEEELIEEIYGALYAQKLRGENRLRMLRLQELARLERHADSVEVVLEDVARGRQESGHYDAVVLATGYDDGHFGTLLEGLEGCLRRTSPGRLSVRRDYAVDTVPGVHAGIYLQGPTEHSHGLTSTLLSILPHRARDILNSAFRTQPRQAPSSTPVEHRVRPANSARP